MGPAARSLRFRLFAFLAIACAMLAVARKDNELSIEVRDDGVGNDQLPGNAGLGVRSMCERARCLGGEVRFLSRMGEGTRIRLAIPLAPLSPNTGGVL